jgi:cytochrome c peroxidase
MNINRIPSLRFCGAVVFVIALNFLLISCKQDNAASNPAVAAPNNPTPVNNSIPKTPGVVVDPPDNPSTAAKIELGRHLFFDKQMSVDGSTSCGSCHQPQHGFSDIFPTSMGMDQQHGNRNAPALANVAYNTAFTWDGRFKTLEAHAPGPIFNSLEMGNNFTNDASKQDSVPSGYNSAPGNNDTNFLFRRLLGSGDSATSFRKDIHGVSYHDLLSQAWGLVTIKTSTDGGKTFTSKTGIFFTMDIIAKSIAAFERTFISTQSDFDKYNNGDQTVFKFNPEALHGFQLFTDVNGANCVSCHSGYSFTDQQFHDNGIGINQQGDKGRFGITNLQSDVGKFKTPSLRNVALTAPYMHDGRFATLDEVLRNYNTGGTHSVNQDSKVKALNLSDQDVADIIEFLKTLTDNNFVSQGTGKFANPWGN